MSDELIAVSEGWRDRQPLSDTALIDFLAPRRVCEYPDSRVDQVGDHYVENERPPYPTVVIDGTPDQ